MLERLTVRGFKSLSDVTLALPRLAVLFGPNAAGKSNVLDAIQALSRIGTQRTLADALGDPIRSGASSSRASWRSGSGGPGGPVLQGLRPGPALEARDAKRD